MTAATGPKPDARGRFKRLVGGAETLFNALMFSLILLILLLGPLPLLLSLQSNDELKEADSNSVVFFLILGIVYLGAFGFYAQLVVKKPEKEHIVTAAALVYLLFSATSILLYALAQLAAGMARNGTEISVHPAQSELHMGDLYQKFVFESLEAVPGLDIPKTLGWEDPISDPAWPLGLMLVMAKVVVLVLFISTVFALLKAAPKMRWGRKPRQAQTSADRIKAGRAVGARARRRRHQLQRQMLSVLDMRRRRRTGRGHERVPSAEATTPPVAD
jgi:hypothetical protein